MLCYKGLSYLMARHATAHITMLKWPQAAMERAAMKINVSLAGLSIISEMETLQSGERQARLQQQSALLTSRTAAYRLPGISPVSLNPGETANVLSCRPSPRLV